LSTAAYERLKRLRLAAGAGTGTGIAGTGTGTEPTGTGTGTGTEPPNSEDELAAEAARIHGGAGFIPPIALASVWS
jgi:hypothetical protein